MTLFFDGADRDTTQARNETVPIYEDAKMWTTEA